MPASSTWSKDAADALIAGMRGRVTLASSVGLLTRAQIKPVANSDSKYMVNLESDVNTNVMLCVNAEVMECVNVPEKELWSMAVGGLTVLQFAPVATAGEACTTSIGMISSCRGNAVHELVGGRGCEKICAK